MEKEVNLDVELEQVCIEGIDNTLLARREPIVK